MRKFFAITELLIGLVSIALGAYEFDVGYKYAIETCIFGVIWLVLAAWGYFLVDWENGWDGRYDAAWVISNKKKISGIE